MHFSNTPTAELDGVNAQTPDEEVVLVTAERLGHDIRQHVLGGHILKRDVIGGDLLADEVVTDVDVLGSSVMLRVLAERDAALALRVDDGGRVTRYAELVQQLLPPQRFSGGLACSHVLGLDRRKRHCGLLL